MKTKTYLFQITIPSVQKLISSSRKSSDLWAGSFMVSYLMKKLLKIVLDKYQAKLIYPVIENIQENEKELIANIPNVAIFKIEDDNPEIIKNLLQDEFQKLLNEFAEFGVVKLFKEFGKTANNEYIELAQYQIKGSLKLFVEYLELENGSKISDEYKKVSEDLANLINYEKKSQLPDRNYIENYQLIKPLNWICFKTWENFYKYEKNNRFQTGTIKGVYRCSSCGEHTIIGATLDDWKGNLIWKPLWEANPKYFNRGERLCGVCLAKRYFRDYLRDKVGIKDESLGFPSTSEIAATLFKKALIEKMKEYFGFAQTLENFKNYFYSIHKFNFRNIGGNPVEKIKKEVKEIFPNCFEKCCYCSIAIDGEWFLEDTWKNENDYKSIGANPNKANQMLKTLQSIYEYLKEKGIEKHLKPSEYYAVIMLDGDSIGEKLNLIREDEEVNNNNPVGTHQKFSHALSKLSKKFKEIVERNYGALIYSGGDDVLALVPVDNALDCAYRIQGVFSRYLRWKGCPKIHEKSSFSMSGAIIYAHHKLPFSFILDEARKCEEKVKEKDKNRVCLKYIKRSLSSAEIILEWDKYKDFKNLKENTIDIPNTFIYQLNQLLKDIGKELNISKEMTKYLLKKKLGKLTNKEDKGDKIEIIINNKLISKNYNQFPDYLKIIKFLGE